MIKLFTVLMLFVTLCIGCGDKPAGTTSPPSANAVSELSIAQMPAKTTYYINEDFSLEGGVVSVSYQDGTTADIPLTSTDLEITAPNLSSTGDKTVIIKYGGKRVTFSITVASEQIEVTFSYGTEDIQDLVTLVDKGTVVGEPAPVEREGFTFDGWFTDQAYTVSYDFERNVSQSITLYAKWLDNSVKYFRFVFDYNNIGSNPSQTENTVKEGECATELGSAPTREGYEFNGWYADVDGTTQYNFDTPVDADTTVYAKWTRTQSMDMKEYVFEAEDLNLKGVSGPGYSGQASGRAMIVFKMDKAASNNMFVSFLYQSGCTLTYRLVSDMDVDDAQLVVRLSAEIQDRVFTPDTYQICVNGVPQEYNPISITDVPAVQAGGSDCAEFSDFSISYISLSKGVNEITLVTTNNDGIDGTTMAANAPLVDCIKITTNAVLTWNAAEGYPGNNY